MGLHLTYNHKCDSDLYLFTVIFSIYDIVGSQMYENMLHYYFHKCY